MACFSHERGVLGVLEQLAQQTSNGGRGAWIAGYMGSALLTTVRRVMSLTEAIMGAPLYRATMERTHSTRTQASSAGERYTPNPEMFTSCCGGSHAKYLVCKNSFFFTLLFFKMFNSNFTCANSVVLCISNDHY